MSTENADVTSLTQKAGDLSLKVNSVDGLSSRVSGAKYLPPARRRQEQERQEREERARALRDRESSRSPRDSRENQGRRNFDDDYRRGSFQTPRTDRSREAGTLSEPLSRPSWRDDSSRDQRSSGDCRRDDPRDTLSDRRPRRQPSDWRNDGYDYSRDRDREPRREPERDPAIFREIANTEEDNSAAINFSKYDEIPVEMSGEDPPPAIDSFEGSALHRAVKQNIMACKFDKPTPVQKHSIPIVLAGRDLMACAQTGSGKTAAFVCPVVSQLMDDPPPPPSSNRRGGYGGYYRRPVAAPSCLILAPTRELAQQIHKECERFAYDTWLRSVVVYGGAGIRPQYSDLERGVDILVATPGRLYDILENSRVSLKSIRYLVLDEADRMLDMGFEPQIRRIVEQEDMTEVGVRKTMMFSATFPKEIQRLAADFLYRYIFLSVGRVGSTTDFITQKVEYVDEGNKRSMLVDLITSIGGLTLVFVETKRGADALESYMYENGFPSTSIHGDRSQREREDALRAFRSGKTPILVATDVAARGLDIPNVRHVVNYDMPDGIDDYVHRIGRTGRAGKSGLATSFLHERNRPIIKDLIDLLEESGQEIPQWLVTLGRQAGTSSAKRRQPQRFGGRDYRRNVDRSTTTWRTQSSPTTHSPGTESWRGTGGGWGDEGGWN